MMNSVEASLVLWMMLFILVPRVRKALTRPCSTTGRRRYKRLQRCAPALLRRWKREAARCREAQELLSASLGDYSALMSCAGMLKADVNMNERALCFTMALTTTFLLHLHATRCGLTWT